MNHFFKKWIVGMKVIYICILLVFLNISHAAKIVLIGENHNKLSCRLERTELSQKASKGKLLLFSENAYVENNNDQNFDVGKLNKAFFGNSSLNNSWGLEETQTKLLIEIHSQILRIEEVVSRIEVEEAKGQYLDDLISLSARYAGLSDEISFHHKLSSLGIYKEIEIDYFLTVSNFKKIQQDIVPIIQDLKLEVTNQIEMISSNLNIPGLRDFENDYHYYANNLREGEKVKAYDYISSVIIWRNYFMISNLLKKIDEVDVNKRNDIYIILGASHVAHFENLLKNVFKSEFKKYKIKKDFSCLNYKY